MKKKSPSNPGLLGKSNKPVERRSTANVPRKYLNEDFFRENHKIKSITVDGMQGIEISGLMYLRDITSEALTVDPSISVVPRSRILTEIYLHPNLAYGRPQLFAKTFTKWRMVSAVVHYDSNVNTETPGNIFATVVHDCTLDPSILLDRQLKIWFDSMPESSRVHAFEPDSNFYFSCDFRDCKDFKTLNLQGDDINGIFCGKIVIGACGTPLGYMGDLYMEYTMQFVDDVITPQDIVRNTPSTPQASHSLPLATLTFPIRTSGTPVTGVGIGTTLSSLAQGIYSCQMKNDDPLGAGVEVTGTLLDKIYAYGSEFIMSVIRDGGGTPYGYLFNSFADLLGGIPTRYTSTDVVALNAGKADLLPLLVDSFTSSLFGNSTESDLMRIKGFAWAKDHCDSEYLKRNRRPPLEEEEGRGREFVSRPVEAVMPEIVPKQSLDEIPDWINLQSGRELEELAESLRRLKRHSYSGA